MSLAVKITLGSSLSALQFAYQNNTKMILNKPNFPHRFEPSYIKHAWGLLYTKLMLDGQTIGGDSVKITRILDDEVIVVCKGNIINKVRYDTIYIFDDEKVVGLPETLKETDEYIVIDILKSISLVTHRNNAVIKTNDCLVNQLYVSKSHPKNPIEIYSISYLNKEQLYSFSYSDTIVKFKSEDILKQNGYVGNYNARNRITLEVIRRIVQKKMDVYKETEKIKFIYGNTT